MTPLSTDAAMAASVTCARSLGMRADQVELVAEGYSLRVLLRPEMVVTRVVTLGTTGSASDRWARSQLVAPGSAR